MVRGSDRSGVGSGAHCNALVVDAGLVTPPMLRVPAVLAGSAQVPVSVMVMTWPVPRSVGSRARAGEPAPKVTAGDAGDVEPAGSVTRRCCSVPSR